MATLNIKNLPDVLYKKLRTRSSGLGRTASIACLHEEVRHLLSEALETAKPVSILERHWEKSTGGETDGAKHVPRERATWD